MIRVYVDTNMDASVLLLVDASTKIADLKKQVERHIAQEYSGGPVGAGKQKIERMNCLFDPISPSRSRENCFTVPDGYDVGSIATDGTAKLFAEYQHAAPAKGEAFVTPVPGVRKRDRVIPVETSNGIVNVKKMKKTDAKETPVGDARENVEKVQTIGEVGTNAETVAESGGLQRTPSSKTLKNQKKREQRKRRRESAKKALEEEKPMSPAVVQREGKPKEKSKEKASGNVLLGSGESKKVALEAKDHGKKAQAGQRSPKKVAAVGKGEGTGKTSSKKQEQTAGDTGAQKKQHLPSSSSSSESSSSSSEEAMEPIEPAKPKRKPRAEQKNKGPEIPKTDKIKALPKSKAPPQPARKAGSSSSSSSESSSSSDSEGPIEPVKAVTEQKQKEKDVSKKTEQKMKEVSKKEVKTAGKSKMVEVPPILPSSSSSSESSKSTSSSSNSEDELMEAPKKKSKADVVKQKTKETEAPKVKETKHVAKPAPPRVAAKDPSSSSPSSSSSESSSSSSDSEEIVHKAHEKQMALTKAEKSVAKPAVVNGSKKKQVQESSSDASTSEDSSTSDSASSSSSSDSESDSEHSKEGEQPMLTPSGKFNESDGRILKHLLASASQPDASKVCVADLKKSAQLEQEQDDLKKKMESESKTYQWQKPFSSFPRESLLKLCRMMVRDAVNQERKAKGLEEAHAAKLYKDENRPDWWPLHNFSASSFDKKKDAVAVYNATRKVLSAIYRVDLQH